MNAWIKSIVRPGSAGPSRPCHAGAAARPASCRPRLSEPRFCQRAQSSRPARPLGRASSGPDGPRGRSLLVLTVNLKPAGQPLSWSVSTPLKTIRVELPGTTDGHGPAQHPIDGSRAPAGPCRVSPGHGCRRLGLRARQGQPEADSEVGVTYR